MIPRPLSLPFGECFLRRGSLISMGSTFAVTSNRSSLWLSGWGPQRWTSPECKPPSVVATWTNEWPTRWSPARGGPGCSCSRGRDRGVLPPQPIRRPAEFDGASVHFEIVDGDSPARTSSRASLRPDHQRPTGWVWWATSTSVISGIGGVGPCHGALNDVAGFTGTLNIRYRSLGVRRGIHLDAGVDHAVQGQKTSPEERFTTVRCSALSCRRCHFIGIIAPDGPQRTDVSTVLTTSSSRSFASIHASSAS